MKLGHKTKRHGRASGGIVVFIRTSIKKHFTQVQREFRYGLAFHISDELISSPAIILFTYLPPQGSNAYPVDEQNGIIHLHEYVTQLELLSPDSGLIIAGDLNARTKTSPDFIIDDDITYLPAPDIYPVDAFTDPRKSRDTHGEINAHGEELLRFCCVHGIHMLNGRTRGDMEGHLTCFTSNGSSLVDYTLMSSHLFPIAAYFTIGEYDDFTHLPQIMNIYSNFTDNTERSPNIKESLKNNKTQTVYKWTADSLNILLESKYRTEFESSIDSDDINNAVESLSRLLQEACVVKSKCNRKESKKTNSKWWDTEMDDLKQQKYKLLRKLRQIPNNNTLRNYRDIRKLYKAKIREKKENIKRENRKKIESCRTPSEFWKFIKSNTNTRNCINKISPDDWKVYFEELLNIQSVTDEEFDIQVNDYISWHDRNCKDCMKDSDECDNDELNENISMNEIELAVNELSNGKATGLDGLSNEIIKNSKLIVVPYLYKLFNKMLEHKFFPELWSQALIVPIHKKGSAHEPNNYRGISLLSCLGKIFTKIMNKRLVRWSENNDKFYDVQGGFMKGKSTIDQIFIFQSVISKYLSKKKGRFYSVFVDFTKAFDSIPHLKLYYSLLKGGIHGRLINILRDMYSKLVSCVKAVDGTISESFKCLVGTRQGCVVSPFLFIFYLNEFISQVETNNCR